MQYLHRNVVKKWSLLSGAHKLVPVVLFLSVILIACVQEQHDPRATDIRKRIDRLKRVSVEFDGTSVPNKRRELLQALVEAARQVHEVYLRQTYPEGIRLRDSLALRGDEFSRQVLRLVIRNGGPFDRMDGFVNFIDQTPHPSGGVFYPPGITAEEIDDYIALFPGRGFGLKSPYTILRRDGGELLAVPFSQAFEEYLVPAADLLQKGASLADNEAFAAYLLARADALTKGNYDTSHVLWLALRDNDVDIRIAPDRVVDDMEFNIRASFTSAVMVKNATESAKLSVYGTYMNELESNLPYAATFKRSEPITPPLILVMQDIYRGGTLAVGRQSVVSSFDRDPLSSPLAGRKKFIAKNILDARTEHVLLPMARELFASENIQYITPEGVFHSIALREISFALGPTHVAGSEVPLTVREALAEYFVPLEIAKAIIVGLHSGKYLIGAGVLAQGMEKPIYVSTVASLLEVLRNESSEPEKRAAALVLNGLLEKGAIRLDSHSGKIRVLFEYFPRVIASFAEELLMMQATGNYGAAEELMAKWSVVGRDLSERLGGLPHVPEDIEPVYSYRW